MRTDSDTDIALDEELHAYVDGKLSPERMAAVEARLAGDDAGRAAVGGWAHDRALIRAAAAEADARPVDMRTELLGRELARRVAAARVRAALGGAALRQVAASVALFAAGWGGHALYVGGGAGASEPGYVVQAVMLDAVRDSRAVDLSESQRQASLEWLSERMQRKIDSPKLEALGLRIVSGRLVEGADGPMAQFTYAREDGGEVMVMMSPHKASEPAYPYSVRSVSGRSVASWTQGDIDVAILGETDPARLAILARAIR